MQHAGSTRKRGKDKTEYFHALLAATLVAPGHNRVVPLEPEFIVPRTVATSRTAKAVRHGAGWQRMAARHARFEARSISATICFPASRYARPCWAGGHFLFVCKPASHQTIEEFRTGDRPDER